MFFLIYKSQEVEFSKTQNANQLSWRYTNDIVSIKSQIHHRTRRRRRPTPNLRSEAHPTFLRPTQLPIPIPCCSSYSVAAAGNTTAAADIRRSVAVGIHTPPWMAAVVDDCNHTPVEMAAPARTSCTTVPARTSYTTAPEGMRCIQPAAGKHYIQSPAPCLSAE